MAIRLAEEQLARNPEDINALLALAQTSYDQEDFPRTAEYLKQLQSLYHDNTDALLLAALLATRDPTRGDPILLLNQALRTGTAARNLTSFLNALEITGYLLSKPRRERPLALLAHYYRVLRIYDGGMAGIVIRTAHRAIQKGDHPADAFVCIGMIYKKAGKPYKALEAFRDSVAAVPSQALAYFQAAVLYELVGDTANQYLYLKNAFRADLADAFYLRALNRFLTDRKESLAIQRFVSEGLTANPNSIPAHAALASSLLMLSEKREALMVFKHLLALPSFGPADLEQQAWAAEWLNMTEVQETKLRHSISLALDRPAPHMELARLFKKTNRLNEALQEFEIAVRLGTSDDIQEYCQLYETRGSRPRPEFCVTRDGNSPANQLAQH